MGNVGFARVETSDEIGKITVHCTTKVVPSKECKVFLLKRNKSMTISKQVSVANSQNGCLDIRLSFHNGCIDGSEFNLKDTQGIVILYSKDNYIAAKWDDSNVSYHEVILLEQDEMIQQPISKVEAAQIKKREEKVQTVQPKIVLVDAADIVTLGKVADIKKEDALKVEDKEENSQTEEVQIAESNKENSQIEDVQITEGKKEADKKEVEFAESKKDDKQFEEVQMVELMKDEGKNDENMEVEIQEAESKRVESKEVEYKEEESKAEEIKEEINEIEHSRTMESKVLEIRPDESKQNMQSVNRVTRGNGLFHRVANRRLQGNSIANRNQEPIQNNIKVADVIAEDKQDEKKEEEKKSIKDMIRENIRLEKEKENNIFESEDIDYSDSLEEIPIDDTELQEDSLHASNFAVPNPNLWADHPSARAILNRFVRMYPFDDGEIAECVRLEPKDIGLLPMNAWVLGNNSFLLHSYCNFRHLLFAKKLTREGCVYLLMVPGAHNNREQQLAKMFGFENFKCSRRRTMRDGEFGYWYVTIVFD